MRKFLTSAKNQITDVTTAFVVNPVTGVASSLRNGHVAKAAYRKQLRDQGAVLVAQRKAIEAEAKAAKEAADAEAKILAEAIKAAEEAAKTAGAPKLTRQQRKAQVLAAAIVAAQNSAVFAPPVSVNS